MPLRRFLRRTHPPFLSLVLICLPCSWSLAQQNESSTPEDESQTVTQTDSSPANAESEESSYGGPWGFSLGPGVVDIGVSSNNDNEFNNDDGIGMMLHLYREHRLSRRFALFGGLGGFNSLEIDISSSSFSYAAFADIGVTMGSHHKPGGVYFSLSAGPALISIGDHSVNECTGVILFCDDRKGGKASGEVYRFTIGRVNRQRTRFQLGYTRVNGEGSDFGDRTVSFDAWHISLGRSFD